ncbi:MAG: helix-turn-helix domain-containing protein, partial [Parabacteroides sp.]|nr:helix-turn-helix domain-containing protein [Parabacteroides sp.]
ALTNKEFELLLFFIENPNIAFSKDTLFDRIWGMDAVGDTATVIHGRYLEEQQTYVADCYYILNAVTLVFGYFSEEYADCWNEQIA